ncbi:UDP-glucosyltransferase 29-like [Benincasa hispida]|uniref:UDP-glucosyltransferase 29-like n=1 Tax=Benincasa hispida TaxID=102211 RepID=UPI001902AC15|nr:UDP-glucosyltransferase 29-like [Benincasa hispida]
MTYHHVMHVIINPLLSGLHYKIQSYVIPNSQPIICIAMEAQQAGSNTLNPTTILMFPWLGYGHLSPYLELAKALTRCRNNKFHIYFCSTPVNLESIKPKLIPSSSSSYIEFVELHLPSSPEFPPNLYTTNALPPHLTPTLHQAFAAAAPRFEAILQTLSPHLLIYDYFQPWAPRLASSLNIPAINFNTSGVSLISHAFHSIHYPDSKYPVSDFVLHKHWKAKLNPAAASEHSRSVREAFFYCFNASCDVILTNSFREVDGEHMDYLSLLLKKKVIPVGPLVYEPNEEDQEDEDYWRIKNWLDKKEALSTVLVSLGSESYASEEEKEEIGKGLEESEANFIWVERINNQKGDEEQKRREFVERAGERAMVVKGWVPQGKILKHGNIGGFVSHCGWNSVLESIVSGVPIIGVPITGDQPFNAGVVKEAGVGVETKRDPDGKIQRQEVAKLIKDVVVEKTREDLRMKVREMSEILRRKREEKIDEMLAQISLLRNI